MATSNSSRPGPAGIPPARWTEDDTIALEELSGMDPDTLAKPAGEWSRKNGSYDVAKTRNKLNRIRLQVWYVGLHVTVSPDGTTVTVMDTHQHKAFQHYVRQLADNPLVLPPIPQNGRWTFPVMTPGKKPSPEPTTPPVKWREQDPPGWKGYDPPPAGSYPTLTHERTRPK